LRDGYGGRQACRSSIEGSGKCGQGGPHSDRVRETRIHAAEQRIDRAPHDLLPEPLAHQRTHRDVGAGNPAQGQLRLLLDPGECPVVDQSGEIFGPGGDAHQRVLRQRVQRILGPDERTQARRMHKLLGQAQFGQ
jgi:hypothetical protein